MKLGPGQTVAEESDLVGRAIETRGRAALLAGDLALIEPKDAVTISFFNESYRRKAP